MASNKGVQLSQPNGVANQLKLPDQQYSKLSGYSPDVVGINRFEPWQRDILKYLGESGLNQLQNPNQGFEPIKQDALSTFFQQIVPQLQEQFSASGSNSASSGTIKSQLSSAGSTLAEKLAAFQAHFGQQNQQNALQQLQLSLNPQSDFIHRQGGGGLWNNLGDLAKAGVYGAARLGSSFLFPS